MTGPLIYRPTDIPFHRLFNQRRNTLPQLSAKGRTFFLILIVLVLVGSFMRDHLNLYFGPVGGLFWVFGFLLTFAVGIVYYAIFILPTGIRNWYEEGFWLIWRHHFREKRRFAATADLKDIPTAVTRFGAGILDSHLVLGISRSRSFSRAAGPGFVQLSPGEYVRQVIDLRRHFREIRVNGVTRDGIPFETTVGVHFGIRRHEEPSQPQLTPYAADQEAIFQACYFGSVEEGEVEIPWQERVAPLVGSELVTELSTYTLDSIYQVEAEQSGPVRTAPIRLLKRVETRLGRDLQRRLAEYGIQLYKIDIADLTLPADVRTQHILNLQAMWEKKGDLPAVQLSDEEIQARAVVDLIQHVVGQAVVRHQVGQERMSDVITGVLVEVARSAAETGRIDLEPEAGPNGAQNGEAQKLLPDGGTDGDT